MNLISKIKAVRILAIISASALLGSCQTTAPLPEQYVQVSVVKDSNQNNEKTAVFARLKHGDAKFISKTIGMSFYLTLGELNLTADERQNAIVVSGKPENVAAAMKLLRALDQPTTNEEAEQE